MQEHLQESMVLSATQWGFRSDRSTVTALISVTQDWYTALEQGNEICAVFFDFQKAFDSVPHQSLISGSIVGPLLFLIYINSLSSIPFSNSTKIHLYADDVLLYHTIDSPEAFYNVQNDINEVAKWSDMNHLTLNKEKCKLMLISRMKYCSNPPVPLTLYGQTLDSVDT